MEGKVPRSSRGPHLYLKRRGDGSPIWYIRDGRNRISTQCGEGDPLGARQAFETYVVKSTRLKFGRGDPTSVSIAAVIALYAQAGAGMSRDQGRQRRGYRGFWNFSARRLSTTSLRHHVQPLLRGGPPHRRPDANSKICAQLSCTPIGRESSPFRFPSRCHQRLHLATAG